MLGGERGVGSVRPEKLKLGVFLNKQALFIVGGRPEKMYFVKLEMTVIGDLFKHNILKLISKWNCLIITESCVGDILIPWQC